VHAPAIVKIRIEPLAGGDEYEWQGDEEECDGFDGFDADFDQ
jgi:hypothetical protein